MSFISMVSAAAPQEAAFNTAGARDSTGSGSLEQMFAQLMQQIQTAMDQPEVGLDLPPDGEALPSDLLARLTDFAEQLDVALSPDQLQQLDALVNQLTAESVPQEQIEQLAQAAMLMQDAQRQKQIESDSLLQLVDTIRATSTDAADSQDPGAKELSIDELLALADRLRGIGSESRADDLVDKGPLAPVVERSVGVESDVKSNALSAAEGADTAIAGQASGVVAAGDSKASATGAAARAEPAAEAGRESLAAEADTVVRQDAVAVMRQDPAAASRANESQASKSAPVAQQSASAASPVSAQAVKADLEGGASGQRGEADQDSQQQGRRETLDRWVELRNSIAAQGQKLAQNDAVFKAALATQSPTAVVAEAGSLVQTGQASSLTQLQQAYQTSTSSNLSLGVGERFGAAQWTPAASQRILWMAGQNISTAELRLDPPELGSLSVRLQIQGDQASLSFTSPHPHVREVLEQQMPRLREMLAENGIELGQADVSDQSLAKESGEEGEPGSGRHSEGDGADLEKQQDGAVGQASMAMSLVDYYA